MTEQKLLLELDNTQHLLEQMLLLPKNKIVNIMKCATKARKEKYCYDHEYRYGDLPKSFTNVQLKTFMKKVFRHETRRIFLIQFFFALRIGELYGIEYLKDQKLLKIRNYKCDRIEYLPVYGKTGKLFEKPLNLPCPENLSKSFRKAAKKAELNHIYFEDEQKRFKLHQFVPHSLRHTALTFFTTSTNNPLKATKLGRWKKKSKEFGSLPTYYYYSMDAMRKDLDKTFKKYYYLIPK